MPRGICYDKNCHLRNKIPSYFRPRHRKGHSATKYNDNKTVAAGFEPAPRCYSRPASIYAIHHTGHTDEGRQAVLSHDRELRATRMCLTARCHCATQPSMTAGARDLSASGTRRVRYDWQISQRVIAESHAIVLIARQRRVGDQRQETTATTTPQAVPTVLYSL